MSQTDNRYNIQSTFITKLTSRISRTQKKNQIIQCEINVQKKNNKKSFVIV